MQYENKRIENKVEERANSIGQPVKDAHAEVAELMEAGYSEQAALSAYKSAHKQEMRRIPGIYRVYPMYVSDERPATKTNYKTNEVVDTTVQDLYGVLIRVDKQHNTVTPAIDKLPFFGETAGMLEGLEMKHLYKFKGRYDMGKNAYYVDPDTEFVEEEDMTVIKMVGNMATNIHNSLSDTVPLQDLQKRDDKGDYLYERQYDIATVATVTEINDINKKAGGTFQKLVVDTIDNDIPMSMSPPFGEEVEKSIAGEECLIICNTAFDDFEGMITLKAKVILPLNQLDE